MKYDAYVIIVVLDGGDLGCGMSIPERRQKNKKAA